MPDYIDLTRVLSERLEPFAHGAYADPRVQLRDWATVEREGFRVSLLSLGTQTGTHIDAPAHFVAGAATVDTLPVESLIGPYFHIDVDACGRVEDLERRMGAHRGEPILFLASSQERPASWNAAHLAALCGVPALVWLTVQPIALVGGDDFHFHRCVAANGRFLIEDVDVAEARKVRPGGTLTALPLRLAGTSGAPCRVVVRNPDR